MSKISSMADQKIGASQSRFRWSDLVSFVLGNVDRWRQRQALAQLDDRMLADLGLTRADVQLETAKPMWHVN